jgi:hypothetical protein
VSIGPFAVEQESRAARDLRDRVDLFAQGVQVVGVECLAHVVVRDGSIERRHDRPYRVGQTFLEAQVCHFELQQGRKRGPERRLFAIDVGGEKREIANGVIHPPVRRVLHQVGKPRGDHLLKPGLVHFSTRLGPCPVESVERQVGGRLRRRSLLVT